MTWFVVFIVFVIPVKCLTNLMIKTDPNAALPMTIEYRDLPFSFTLGLVGTSEFNSSLSTFCKSFSPIDRSKCTQDLTSYDVTDLIFSEFKSLAMPVPAVVPMDAFSLIRSNFQFWLVQVSVGEGTENIENLNVYWWGETGTGLSIGRFVYFGEHVSIFLGGNHFYRRVSMYPFRRTGLTGFEADGKHSYTGSYSNGPVVIGPDVWISSSVIVLSGVTIGVGAYLAPHTLVRSNVPPYAIVRGNPGVVVGYRFSSHEIDQLVSSEWWNQSSDLVRSHYHLLAQNRVQDFVHLMTK